MSDHFHLTIVRPQISSNRIQFHHNIAIFISNRKQRVEKSKIVPLIAVSFCNEQQSSNHISVQCLFNHGNDKISEFHLYCANKYGHIASHHTTPSRIEEIEKIHQESSEAPQVLVQVRRGNRHPGRTNPNRLQLSAELGPGVRRR